MSSFLCNLNGNSTAELQNFLLQNLAADPAGAQGKFYLNTVDDTLRYFSGGAWQTIGPQVTTLFQNTVAGNKIGDYTNELGATVDVNESITSLDVATTPGSAIYTAEGGAQTTFTESSVVLTTDGNTTGVTQSGTSNHTVDIRLLSQDLNNALTTGADGGVYFNALEQNVVDDIAARGALTDLQTGETAYVVDASADATVTAGAALYVWGGAAWQKIAEFESVESFKSVTVAQAQAGALVGRTIATANDGDAVTPVVNIQETVTTQTLSATNGTVNDTLTLISEDNTTVVATLVRKMSQTFSSVAATEFSVVHNFGSDVTYTLYDSAGFAVNACVREIDNNTLGVTTNLANANLKIVVIG